MYNAFFGFREPPFSIAPDPRYLYLSERHKEALAHLMYGVQGQGGFIVITGEVGTGKTTVCRCFLDSIPGHVDVALILNPRLSARELLGTICDELGLSYPAGASIKRLIDQLNKHLLEAHAQGRHTVLIIDEAQNLNADVLEQLRLLTNLETREKKLLQIVLLGQPELQDMLATPQLRQLSQRVTARYHLDALSRNELESYVRYRLSVAGQRQQLFDDPALHRLYRLSRGIPRLINLIADRALLGAYAQSSYIVDKKMVKQAAKEVLGDRLVIGHEQPQGWVGLSTSIAGGVFGGVVLAAVVFGLWSWIADPQAQTASPGSESWNPIVREEQEESASGASNGNGQPPSAGAVSDGSRAQQSGAQVSDGALLANFEPGEDNGYDAYRALFSLWGFEFNRTDHRYACDYAERRGLRCWHRQGNWRSLMQLNRPAVLRLFSDDGQEYLMTLTKVEDGVATFELGGESYKRSLEVIDQHWLGDYSLLWQVPPYDSALIKPGDVTDKRLWLKRALIQLRKRYEVNGLEAVRLAKKPIEEQIRWYQRQVGLVPDGIPGTMTLIHMNSDLVPGVPRLMPSQQASMVVSKR